MIGGIAVIASVVRIHALWVYFNSDDPGYDAIKVRKIRPPSRYKLLTMLQVLLWGQIEINVAIVCASVASLRPLFQSVFANSESLSRSGGLQYQNNRSYGLGSSHFGDTIELTTKDGVNTKVEAQIRDMDSDSQELILDRDEGIRRTIETQMTSERAAGYGFHAK